MKNIWIIFAPILAMVIILFIAIIVVFIKRPKNYIMINVMLAVLIVLWCIFALPTYFDDLVKQETNSFEGVYAYSVTTGVSPGTKYLKFKNGEEEDYLIVPRITKEFNLTEGATYRITYLVNTHIVYSVEMIE